MYLRTNALSLIRYDFKERASRYILLTRELGKIEARMEGARNIHSKLSPHTEPVSLVDAYFVKGRAGFKIIQATCVKRFGFRISEQWSFAAHFIETFDRLVPEEIEEPEVYELAVQTLHHVESMAVFARSRSDGESFSLTGISRGLWGFLYLRLLYHLGYFPGNLLLDAEQRGIAERLLSETFERGVREMEGNETLTALALATVKELLQTENKSSGFLREVLTNADTHRYSADQH